MPGSGTEVPPDVDEVEEVVEDVMFPAPLAELIDGNAESTID